MKQNRKKNNSLKNTPNGFTLIELIITVIAIGVFGSITANILANASKIYSETLKKQKFVSEARSSFFSLNRDLNLQTWPTNDNISNSKIINIKSSNLRELEYQITNENKLRLKIIQDDVFDPTAGIAFSTKTNYSSSNIYYYNNENNLVSDNSDANSVSLTRLNILFNYPTDGYSMNLESYVSPYNFRFGRPMDYHE